MKGFLQVLFSLDLFLLGVFLILLPWLGFWEHNFFLQKYPEMIPIALNSSVRGVVSGLGVLDIVIAGGMLRGQAGSVATHT
jgi:hypothetical protein